jgi:transposase-like protein
MAESVELKDRAREYYASNPNVTIEETAEEFGISFETARDWAQTYSWVAERRKRRDVTDDNILSQAAGIRKVLYNMITDEEQTAGNIVELVKAWKSTITIQAPAEKEEEYDPSDLLSMLNEADKS